MIAPADGRKISKDLEGNEVVEGDMPGIGTRLIINGNIFRIVYTKPGKSFRFSAEYVGKHNAAEKPGSAVNS